MAGKLETIPLFLLVLGPGILLQGWSGHRFNISGECGMDLTVFGQIGGGDCTVNSAGLRINGLP